MKPETERKPEVPLWIALIVLAAALRLSDLGTAPLSSSEAIQALAAYRAAHSGVLLPETASISPALFHLNVVLFALSHGGDGLARLVPALCGVGLAATPLLLRRYLGRWGALGAGLMFALSPTLLAFSRTLDSAVPAALGVMLLVGAFAQYLDSWRSLWLPVGGVGLALALTSGPVAWGLLVGLLLALATGLYFWREQVAWYWPMIRPALGRGLVACGLGLFAFGAGLGFHLPGLAAAGEQCLRWLRVNPSAISSAPRILASEPLVLLAGLVGAALALARRHGMGLLWVFWALVGAVQWLLGFGQGEGQGLALLVPLAGLGGIALEEMARLLRTRRSGTLGGVYLLLSLVLWAHFGLALTRYSRSGSWRDLVLTITSLALQVILALVLGLMLSVPAGNETPEEALRRALSTALHLMAAALGIMVILTTFAIGWRVTHFCPGNPACALTADPTAPDVRLLADQIRYVGIRQGMRWPPVAFLGEMDPALAWALRELDLSVVRAEEITEGNRPLILVAPPDVSPPSGYVGTAFTLRRTWVPPQMSHQWVRWWFYRESPTPAPAAAQVILWVQSENAQ